MLSNVAERQPALNSRFLPLLLAAMGMLGRHMITGMERKKIEKLK